MSLVRFIPLFIILLISLRGNTTLLPHNTVVMTSTTITGTTSINPPSWSLNYTDLTRKGVVTLGVDHHYTNYINQSVTQVTINVARYASYSASTPSSNETKILTVSYYPIDSATFVDENTVTIDNTEKMVITVTQIKVNGTIQTTLPANLYIQGDVFVDRIYDFLPQTNFSAYNLSVGLPVDSDCDEVNDELIISWDLVPGAEEYQLEWTFINSVDVAALDIPNLKIDFRNNSTRISTSDLSYKISLIFDKGFVCFRVRAVGRSLIDQSKYLFSPWSIADGPIALGSISSSAKHQITTPFDVKKNWQYNATYAEEGKRKEVISFFDGSLRDRQKVTKMNTDQTAIVGETIYDHMGRPVIQVLPVPVSAPNCNVEDTEYSLKYYSNFNKNGLNLAYSKSDFDVANPADSCNPIAIGAMNTSSGASNYYSTSNSEIAGSQSYVVDAEGYPFTQIEYMPDNTGRIRRQGGVGKKLQLGSGHETFNFYSHPLQEQLDRLFGSEVGDASHYQKNMVIDPNGQVSVAYLDQEGRTIATSLAGQAPNNLSTLPSAAAIAPLNVELFTEGPSTSNKLSTDGTSKVFNQTISLSSVSDVTISYDITVPKFTNSCLGNLCFNCVYDLSIEVRDLCGKLVSPAAISDKMAGRFTINSNGDAVFQTDCAAYSFDTTFVIEDLPVGTYQITKKLTVNQEALDAYMDMYTDPTSGVNTCIEDYTSILDQVGASSDIDDCEDDFSCAECAANLGSLLEYINAGGTEEQYQAELDACNAPCKAASYYENMRNILLVDVRPNGQYGEYLNNQNQVQPTLFPLSVLNTGNSLPKASTGAHWKNPKYDVESTIQNYYFESDGVTRSRIILDNVTIVSNVITASTPAVQASLTLGNQVQLDPVTGDYYTYPQYLLSLSDFVNYYSANPYWANSLVYYHPEYQMLTTYRSFYVKANPSDPYSSESFDQKMMSINTWALAQTEGFINSMTGSVNARVNHFWDTPGGSPGAFLRDPFGLANAALNTKIMNYTVINGTTYSMMQVAAMMNRGGNNLIGAVPTTADLDLFADVPGNTTTQNTQLRDEEWMTFRGMYLAAKQEIQQTIARTAALTNATPGYNDCIGNLDFNPFAYNFFQITPFTLPFFTGEYFNTAQPCAVYTRELYKYKQIRFGTTLANVNTDPSQIAYQQYILTGQCPIAVTFERMLSEAANTGVLDDNGFQINFNALSGLVLSMQDFELPVSMPTLTWNQVTNTSSVLEAAWQDGSSTFGTFRLVKDPGSMVYNWSNIVSFSHIHFTQLVGSLYEFTIKAKVNIGGTLYTQTLTGNTTFKIGNCTFPDVCKKNDFGKALKNITNSLAQMSTLSSTSLVDLSSNPYVTFVDNSVKYTVNPAFVSGGTVKWLYNAAIPGFELTDGTATIRIKILSATPSTLTLASIPLIKSIADLIPGPNNTMELVCNDASGNYLGTMSCDLIRNGNVMIPVGECGLDDAILCTGEEYDTYDDLMAVLKFSLENQNEPFNLYNTPLWTSVLNSQLPSTPTAAGIIGTDDVTRRILTYDIPGSCDLVLKYTGVNPSFSYDNIVSVNDIRLLDQNYFGSYNNFRLYITYSVGGTLYNDSLDGSSCFNLKVCTACTQAATEDMQGPASPEQTDGIIDLSSLNDELFTQVNTNSELYCLDMYEDYVSAYQMFAAQQAENPTCPDYATLYPMMTYADFVKNGYCCGNNMYASMVNILSLAYAGACPTRLSRADGCNPFNPTGDDCKKIYALYANEITIFNSSAWATANGVTLPTAPTGTIDCKCLAGYSNYLLEYLTASATENLSHPMPIADYCAKLTATPESSCSMEYDQYVTAVKNYNLQNGIGAPIAILDYDVFIDKGLCYCVDEYCSELNLRLNGIIRSKAPDLLDFCLSDPEVPCVMDTATLNYETFDVTLTDPCTEFYQSNNEVNAQIAYNEQIQMLQTQLGTEYIKHCMGALENMNLLYNEIEHHFTLYYYDQAGNLIKTVPPEGVELININDVNIKAAIKADRLNNTHNVITNHRMATTYLYNSLNQLVAQNMPDQDAMEVFEITLPNGLPTGLSTSAIQMVDANQGYLSGYMDAPSAPMLSRGYLYKTTNGGLNWTRVTNTLGSDLKEVKMATATIGYALGTGGIVLVTTDGGQNWDLVNTSLTSELSAIEVVGTDAYVLERIGGRMRKITSAGAVSLYATPPTGTYTVVEWKDFTLQGNVTNLTGIVYLVTLTESSVNYDAVITTNSSGGYVVDKTLVGNLSAMSFINATDAVVTGDDGNISFINGNSTATYRQQLKLSGTAGLIDQIFMLDELKGIARITENGVKVIRKTTDGGLTWIPLQDNYAGAKLSLVRRTGTSLEVMLNGNTGAPLNRCYTKNILITSAGAISEIDQTPSLPQSFNFDLTGTYNDGTNVTYFGIGLSGGNYRLYRSNSFTGMSANVTYTDVALVGASSIVPKEIVVLKSGSGVAVEVLATNGIIYRSTAASIGGTYSTFTPFSGVNSGFVSIDKITISSLEYIVAYRETDKRIYCKPATSPGPYYYYASTFNPGTSVIAKLAVHGSNVTVAGTNGGIFTTSAITAAPTANGSHSITFTDRTQHRLRGLTSLRRTASAILITGQNGQVFTRPISAATNTVSFRAIGSTSDVSTANEYVSSSIAYYLVAGADGLLKTLKSTTWALEPDLYTTTGSKVSDHSATNDIRDIAVSGLSIYLVGENGSVYYTPNIVTDFFTPGVSITNKTLQGVDFVVGFTNKATAVGTGSEVIRLNTTFGTKINRVFSAKMNDVHFQNGQYGTVIGDYYFVRSTTDGGMSWKINVPSTVVGTAGLTKVWTKANPNGTHFAVIGGVNYFLKADNGVVTHTALSGTVNDIEFSKADPLFGYVAYTNSLAKISISNLGSNYTLSAASYTGTSAIRGIHVFENKSAIMVGDAGKIHYFRYSNSTNYALATVSGAVFRDVYFLDNKIGLAVGNSGAIYKLYSPNNDNVTRDVLASGFSATNQLFTDPLSIAPSLYNINAIAFSSQNTAIYGGNFLTTANANANQAMVRNLKFENGLFTIRYYYDRLGRVIVSQNSRQSGSPITNSDDKYAYTLYDELGRIKESGEMSSNGDGGPAFSSIFGTNVGGVSIPNVIDDAKYLAWLDYDPILTRKEVTKSYYDKTNTVISSEVTGLSSLNTATQRKRVIHVTYSEVYYSNANEYDHATHYDYDIHGNVKTLYQDNRLIKNMSGIGDHRIKRLDYVFDLISGNVHRVDYQTGQSDQWHYVNIFDDDNRISSIYTTTETPFTTKNSSIASLQNEPELSTMWDREIIYEYYRHGQLARTVIGDQEVQGVDYTYTIQSWIKGVNSNTLDPNRDPGMDGASLSPNHSVAKDVYGYSLHYFTGDYIGAIGGNNSFVSDQTGSDLAANAYDLYNGNIAKMVTTITNPNSRAVLPLGNAYKYDQLNRIKESNSFNNLNLSTNSWGTGQAAKYKNVFTYDANGNIMTQVRYDGATVPVLIDNLSYKYKDVGGAIGTANPKKHNRLYQVVDTKDYNDLDIHIGQNANNYTYDAEGRLIGDAQEKISNIVWRVDGKVKKVIHTSGSGKKNVSFDYDAMGQRIAKHTYSDANVLEKSTYYIVDAKGNTISVYERSISSNASSISYTQTEKHIQGTTRIGTHTERIQLLGTLNDVYSMSNIQHHIGAKNYELRNHLGNVLTIISDKVIPHNNGGTIDYFMADIIQSTDYSAFGVILEGRNFVPDPSVESFPTTQTIHSTDFENPTITTVGSVTTVDGWGHYSSTTLSIDNTATKRLKVVSTNGSHGAHQFFAVPVGVPHTLTVKVDKGTAPNVNILVFYNCPSMTSNSGSLYAITSATTNGTFTVNFTSTTGYIFVQMRQAGTYYLDDIAITNNSGTGGTLVHSRVYRYGFQAQERDDDIKEGGNSVNFSYRMHDPRLGRFFAIDPLATKYAYNSPYAFSENRVLDAIELEGCEAKNVHYYNMTMQKDGTYQPIYHHSSTNLVTRTNNGTFKNSKTGKKSAFSKGDHGTQNVTTNVYTYWNSDGTIKSQVVQASEIRQPITVRQFDARVEDGKASATVLDASAEYSSNALGAKGTFTALQAYAYANTYNGGNWGVGAGATTIKASVSGRLGNTQEVAVEGTAEGSILSCEAKLGAKGPGRSGIGDYRGIYGEAGAGAWVAKGTLSGKFSLFGASVEAGIDGYAVGAAIGGSFGAGYNYKTQAVEITVSGDVALMLGLGVDLKISIPF